MVRSYGSEEVRNLRSSDNDWLPQVLEHEAERGGSVGEGVGAVEDDKAVVVPVGALDIFGDLDPVVHGHVGGVQEGIVLVDGVDDPLVLGHLREDKREELPSALGIVASFGA